MLEDFLKKSDFETYQDYSNPKTSPKDPTKSDAVESDVIEADPVTQDKLHSFISENKFGNNNRGTTMRLNSNTVVFKKESREYQDLEDKLLKIAASNSINDVSEVNIKVSKNESLIKFKKAIIDTNFNEEFDQVTTENINRHNKVFDIVEEIVGAVRKGYLDKQPALHRIYNLLSERMKGEFEIEDTNYDPETGYEEMSSYDLNKPYSNDQSVIDFKDEH